MSITAMKKLVLIIFVVPLISACADLGIWNDQSYYQQEQEAREEYDARFDSIVDSLRAKRDAGEITEIGFSEGLLFLSKEMYPKDYLYQSLFRYRLFLSHELEAGRITQPEFQYKLSEKVVEFGEKSKLRDDAARQYVPSPSRPDMVPFILQGIGNSLRNAYPPPPPYCMTTGWDGIYSTTCY